VKAADGGDGRRPGHPSQQGNLPERAGCPRRRGYVPAGRGACQCQWPLRKGMLVAMDDDLIIWLTKDLAS
jgi:hypothetical protein